MVRLRNDAAEAMGAGLDRIRDECEVPSGFPIAVMQAADEAAARPIGDEHTDRTDMAFATLDPVGSVDLDQAFAIDAPARPDGDIVLHYAIADVGWFVRPGDALDTEAFRRGVTVYLHQVGDPGNVGTLCRSAVAFGAAGLACSPRTADAFGTRALRAGMGAQFLLPVATEVAAADLLSHVAARAGRGEVPPVLVVADPRGSVPAFELGRHLGGDTAPAAGVANNGSAGSVLTMPIINQPQVGIISTDAIVRRPVVANLPDGTEAIVVHPVGNLAMSWDHRAFDGAYAAGFLKKVKEILETRDWSTEL